MLDMLNAACMIAAGSWLDKTGGFAAALTLWGHHELVLIMAAVGFAMLVGLKRLTHAFTSAGGLEVALIAIACAVSIVAGAAAVAAVVLLPVSVFLSAFVGRLLVRR
jgi:hypothetical protein